MSKASTTIPTSYMALIRAFPLHPIRTAKEYEAASAVLDRLAVRDEATLDAGERDYLEMVEMLIDAYDEKNVQIDADVSARTPVEWLRALMQSSGTTPAGLRKILGVSQPLVSLILSGDRGISKSNVTKLAAHFHVNPSLFIGPATIATTTPPAPPAKTAREKAGAMFSLTQGVRFSSGRDDRRVAVAAKRTHASGRDPRRAAATSRAKRR